MPAPSESASSWISSLKIPLLNRRKSLDSSLTSSAGPTEAHVVEGDVRTLVKGPVGAFLQDHLVDASTHPGQRQREHTGQVSRVQAGSVDRGAATFAGLDDPGQVCGRQRLGIEQEGGRDDVLARLEQRADLVQVRVAWHVEDTVGVRVADRLQVARRRHADRVASGQHAEILAVLLGAVHPAADQVEVVAVDDGPDRLDTLRAGRPLNHSIRHRGARYRSAPQ